jgi:hypothetical protein
VTRAGPRPVAWLACVLLSGCAALESWDQFSAGDAGSGQPNGDASANGDAFVGQDASANADGPQNGDGTTRDDVTTDAPSGRDGPGGSDADGGRITFVQVADYSHNQGISQPTLGIPIANQAAGDLNVVAIGWYDSTTQISAVHDSNGNTYAQAVAPISVSGQNALTQCIYFAAGIASGNNTVTVDWNSTPDTPDVRVLEYSGLDPSNPLDGTASNSGSGEAVTAGPATAAFAPELVFAAGVTSGAQITASPGFASRVVTNLGNLAQDEIASSAGPFSVTGDAPPYGNPPTTWVMQIATFH